MTPAQRLVLHIAGALLLATAIGCLWSHAVGLSTCRRYGPITSCAETQIGFPGRYPEPAVP